MHVKFQGCILIPPGPKRTSFQHVFSVGNRITDLVRKASDCLDFLCTVAVTTWISSLAILGASLQGKPVERWHKVVTPNNPTGAQCEVERCRGDSSAAVEGSGDVWSGWNRLEILKIYNSEIYITCFTWKSPDWKENRYLIFQKSSFLGSMMSFLGGVLDKGCWQPGRWHSA